MHMAVCMFGWPLSPEAAGEVFRMSFPWNRGKSVLKENDFFMDSPTVQKALKGLQEGQRKMIAFKGETAYNTANPDHRVALAVNPGFLYKKDGKVYLESYAHYPYYSATPITIFGSKIIIHEGLFHYLEEIGWMHPYTMTWWCNNADLGLTPISYEASHRNKKSKELLTMVPIWVGLDRKTTPSLQESLFSCDDGVVYDQ